MGFFSNLFQKKKPKTFQELIEEEHPTEWYASLKSNDLLVKIYTSFKNVEERKVLLTAWFIRYVNSLQNIKDLKMRGVNINEVILGAEMADIFEHVVEQYDTVAQKVFYGKQYIFDETKNPYLRFMKKLNHPFFGFGAKMIGKLIFLSYVDVDRATWLYDKALFAPVPDDTEEGEKLFEKLSDFLYENNIITDEILEEVGELF